VLRWVSVQGSEWILPSQAFRGLRVFKFFINWRHDVDIRHRMDKVVQKEYEAEVEEEA
jgi:hypothetical protein